jgi:NADH-quinone oxidoreductase subunit N
MLGVGGSGLGPLLPVLLPGLGGVWILLVVALKQRQTLRTCAALTMVILGLSAVSASLLFVQGGRRSMLHGALLIDPQALAFHLLFVVIAAFTVLISIEHLERAGAAHGEFYALILMAVSGMTILAGSENLLSLFLGLELLSIPLYILAGFVRERVYAIEASMKYFLLGAFSTGFILYGMALLYGATGRIDLPGIGEALASTSDRGLDPILLVGGTLLLIGLGFKVAAVPFHFWAPDVYQGALAPVAGFMATGTKAAAFAALIRVLTVAIGDSPIKPRWIAITAVIAILTMLIGNVTALAQQNIKRMLAYSSIANAGYLLMALAAIGKLGQSAGSILFYLVVYAFMTLGAFAVAAILGRDGEGDQGFALSAYAGLGRRRPLLAAAMTLFMLSLTGIPPAAGFMAKFYIFRDVVDAGLVPLAAVGLLASVVGAFYYLRVVVQIYFRDPVAGAAPAAPLAMTDAVAILLAVFAVLALGLFPSGLLTLSSFVL